MQRSALVIAAVGLTVAGVVLYFILSGGDDAASIAAGEPGPASAPPPPVATSPRGATPPPSLPGATVTERGPRQPAAIDPAKGPREYVVGDVNVRDHRSGDRAPMTVPPAFHKPEGRQLPSTLTSEISQKVKDVMYGCTRDLPREGRGDRPKLEGQLVVGVTNRKLSITGTTLELRDLDAAIAEPARQCIEQKARELSALAADEEDLQDYPITISFTVP
jgi:hypothetical protein